MGSSHANQNFQTNDENIKRDVSISNEQVRKLKTPRHHHLSTVTHPERSGMINKFVGQSHPIETHQLGSVLPHKSNPYNKIVDEKKKENHIYPSTSAYMTSVYRN